MKRTRSIGKVLCLGMSYADVGAQIENEGFDSDVLRTKVAGTKQVVECIQRNILTEMDGRDLARCLAMEKKHNVEAYTVSQEKASIYHNRHLNANFSRNGFVRGLQRKFGQDVQFRQIILDYFWIPKGSWQQSHWTKNFFSTTIPLLADLLEAPKQVYNSELQGGSFYLPFCLHCITQLVACLDEIKEVYKITFVRKSQLKEVALWSGTSTIDATTMQEVLGKDKNQEEIYCTFQPRDIYEAADDPSVSKDQVLHILRRIEDFEQVRMIRLQPLSIHEKRSCVEHGGFVDLMNPRFIDRGFDSLPGSRTDYTRHDVHLVSETDTDEETQEVRRMKKPAKRKNQQKLVHFVKRRKAPPKSREGNSNEKKDDTTPRRLFTVVDDLESYERLQSDDVARIFEIRGSARTSLFPFSERTYNDIVDNLYPEPANTDLVTSAKALMALSGKRSIGYPFAGTKTALTSKEMEAKTFYRCCHPTYEKQMKKTVWRAVQRMIRYEVQWSEKFEWETMSRPHLVQLPSQLEALLEREKSSLEERADSLLTQTKMC